MKIDATKKCNRLVYKISSPTVDLVYYGSTSKRLSSRMSLHLSQYRRWLENIGHFCSSFIIFNSCDDYKIEELAKLEDCTKREIEQLENTYITGSKCINKHKSFVTTKEKRDVMYKCWALNKERYNQSVKRCWNENRDRYNATRREKYHLKKQRPAEDELKTA